MRRCISNHTGWEPGGAERLEKRRDTVRQGVVFRSCRDTDSKCRVTAITTLNVTVEETTLIRDLVYFDSVAKLHYVMRQKVFSKSGSNRSRIAGTRTVLARRRRQEHADDVNGIWMLKSHLWPIWFGSGIKTSHRHTSSRKEGSSRTGYLGKASLQHC
ncbi:hypothetical protein CAEBREN_10941 [Caenorhabditis brenneri]|uniref:Uncharacterized protein n=1 Tax=Caenorhabditis brenneri TaxID=135651 RepID=G0NX21_CAEBE|nr:hypothetical protein CAEBREN_10941 [Caenorhabditis brenneri]